MVKGTVSGGSASSLAANDASCMTVTAAKSGGKYTTDWYGSAVLAHPAVKLTLTYDGSYSASRTQTLYLYNWSKSSWTQVDQASVGTSDLTRTYTTTSPGNFVSSTGEVRVRVLGSQNRTSFNCRGDYVAVTYDYQQGTSLAEVATDPGPAPAAPGEAAVVDDEIALAMAPNPAFRSTRLSFTLSKEADIRLEVFDLTGRRVATPFTGRVTPGTTSVDWTLAREDGGPVPAGVYFARLEGLGKTAIARLVVVRR
jgi:hypothetical protein